MATPQKRMTLVCAALALCNVLVAAAAQAQGASFIARRDFEVGTSPMSFAMGGPCVPNCDGRNCGPDGCGGSCGDCPPPWTCPEGRCVGTCVPDCVGRQCGPDGCGGLCGCCAHPDESCGQFGDCHAGCDSQCSDCCNVCPSAFYYCFGFGGACYGCDTESCALTCQPTCYW